MQEVLDLIEDRVGKMKKDEGEGRMTESDILQKSKGGQDGDVGTNFEDREHSWLDNLPSASESMGLDRKSLQRGKSGLFKENVKKKVARGRKITGEGTWGRSEGQRGGTKRQLVLCLTSISPPLAHNLPCSSLRSSPQFPPLRVTLVT